MLIGIRVLIKLTVGDCYCPLVAKLHIASYAQPTVDDLGECWSSRTIRIPVANIDIEPLWNLKEQ